MNFFFTKKFKSKLFSGVWGGGGGEGGGGGREGGD